MLDIAICDDDLRFSGALEELLIEMGKSYGIGFDIDVFQNGSGLVRAIHKGHCFDIICLDIQMDDMDGVETARQIREIDRVTELIYITSYDSYMKEVFSVSPSGFIVKPIKRGEFEKTFYHVMRGILDQDDYYRFRYSKEDYKLPVRDIFYFRSELRKTIIVCIEGVYQEYRKLSEIKETLDQGKGQFLRVHKSFLVNYRHIIKISQNQIELDNGDMIPVGRAYRELIDEQMAKLLRVLPR